MGKSKTLEQAIDELLKNYESVIQDACAYATDRACEDIYQYAMSCLESYYDNYEPNSYQRTDHLWRAILPYAENPRKEKDTIVSTVGIEYDASVLEDVYYGSKKYSPTDGEWVLSNYLQGIHPVTNGSSDPNTVVYYEITDAESPYNKMQSYLTTVVPENFRSSLISYFIKWMGK